MRVSFLGTHGYPSLGNQTIAILLEHGTEKVLLDCGASVINQLETARCLVTDLDGIVVSHIHPDHSSGIPLVFMANVMERFYTRAVSDKTELTLAMEALTFENYLPLLKTTFSSLLDGDWPVKVYLRSLSNTNPASTTIRDCHITTYPVSHTVPTLACRCEWAGLTIVYLSDTALIDDLDAIAQGADLLICNVIGPDRVRQMAHRTRFLTSGEAADLAERAGVHCLVLQHLFFYERDRDEVCKEAQARFSGSLVIPRDGEFLDF